MVSIQTLLASLRDAVVENSRATFSHREVRQAETRLADLNRQASELVGKIAAEEKFLPELRVRGALYEKFNSTFLELGMRVAETLDRQIADAFFARRDEFVALDSDSELFDFQGIRFHGLQPDADFLEWVSNRPEVRAVTEMARALGYASRVAVEVHDKQNHHVDDLEEIGGDCFNYEAVGFKADSPDEVRVKGTLSYKVYVATSPTNRTPAAV